MREKAEQELGPKFDVRAFHDMVSSSGAIPLDTLEAKTTAWIAASQSR